jgi:hypothetical protein
MMILFAIVDVFVLSSILYIAWKPSSGLIRTWFWPAWLLKCIAGIGLGLLYSRYYQHGDTWTYYHDALILTDLARNDPAAYLRFLWDGAQLNAAYTADPRAMSMVKFTSVLALFGRDNYWTISLFYSTLSFLASWRLILILQRYVPASVPAAMLGVWFFPSVVLWSSGVIKESLAMSGLFFIASVVVTLWTNNRPRLWEWLISLVALWMVWTLKYYFLAVFLPFALTALALQFFFSRYRMQVSIPAKAAIWVAVFLIPLIAVSTIHPNFYPEYFLDVIVSNYNAFAVLSEPGEIIHYDQLQPTLWSMLRNMPNALFSGFFRPFIWEATNVLQVALAFENLTLLALTLAACRNVGKLFRSPYRLLMVSVLMYAMVLCIFLALSTPNFGTLSRYRVGFLPFYVAVIATGNPVMAWISRLKQR